ncbi:MAG: hypothetical protein ACD_86C00001G0004 [uncultured bacterium]|nr:MAG: hypothetical protein ACD_86C00001G0004 [uncultured bacterium]
MASPTAIEVKALVPNAAAQKKILEFSQRILTEHQKFSSYHSKMEVIDEAYYRYQANMDATTGMVTGQGIDAATTPVGVVDMPSTTPPVVVSQVDSMVAYLAEVFLSGYPMFPVVSSPANKVFAEQLETLLDDHANIGGYARQLLLFFRDGVKYNLSAIETPWDSIEQYSMMDDLAAVDKRKVSKDRKSYTKVKRLDPYNTIWDSNVPPGDVSAEGDYAGYIEILSRIKAKRKLQRLADDGEAFNIREALTSVSAGLAGSASYYRIHPQVSNYISARKPISGLNWYTYLTGKEDSSNIGTDNLEFFTFYARILPSEFSLNSPSPNTVQIWKFTVVNSSVVVQAKRIISAYDYLPILFGQPLEDGLGYQTQSVAEGNIPFQQAASTLFNISFNSARRAVSDRAIYDSDLIKSSDINAPVPAPKIPVKTNSLMNGKSIKDAYYQIPFDARGTEGALQSGMQIVSFGKELSGLNSPMQGQFQKGNKSVQEWNDTMGGADSRLRLPALTLEFQVFQPLKNILKLNIFQYGEDVELVSQKTGESIKVDIAALRSKVLEFRIADGYTPKSKLAGTESITVAMQMIATSPILQQSFGTMLPGMFSHLLQLMGVRGMEEYVPSPEQQQAFQQQQNAMEVEKERAMTEAQQPQQPQQGV